MDKLVSIRIPESLLNEIKSNVKPMHFMDVSDMVRSILRRKYEEYRRPNMIDIDRVRREIRMELEKEFNRKKDTAILEELIRIRDELKRNEGKNVK